MTNENTDPPNKRPFAIERYYIPKLYYNRQELTPVEPETAPERTKEKKMLASSRKKKKEGEEKN